jgi:hypothetical protein
MSIYITHVFTQVPIATPFHCIIYLSSCIVAFVIGRDHRGRDRMVVGSITN